MTLPLVQSNFMKHPDKALKHSFVVFDELSPVGYLWAKFGLKTTKEVPDDIHVSMIFVALEHRRRGLGKKLFKAFEASLEETQITTIHLGKDHHHFFPGLPQSCHPYRGFFESCGFKSSAPAHDLILHDLASLKLPPVSPSTATIRPWTSHDHREALNFFKNHFPGRWFLEYEQYAQNPHANSTFYLAMNEDTMVGFCRVNHANENHPVGQLQWQSLYPNLAGIGPLGVAQNSRNQGIASHLIQHALTQLQTQNASDVLIDWTGHVAFYQRFGFDVCETYETYAKSLKG
jgi:ribosomal protein S18 acetylase RimI-like enzyme